MWHPLWHSSIAVLLVPALIYASWSDYRFHRVPNWLNLSIAAAGLAMQAIVFGSAGVSAGVLGMVTGFGCLIALWLMRCMGAGDVKLMAAIGTWLGPAMTLQAVLVGAIIGGVFGILLIVVRNSWRESLAGAGIMMRKVSSWRTAFSDFGAVRPEIMSGTVMPYAIPLSVGTLVALLMQGNRWWGML